MSSTPIREGSPQVDGDLHVEDRSIERIFVRSAAELEQRLTQAKTMMRVGESILIETWNGQQFEVRVAASCVTGVMDLQLRRLGNN